MLAIPHLGTKDREHSDMADLEILGSISFDLQINKDQHIKQAFVSLVGKLGTPEFLEEYAILYQELLETMRAQKEASLFDAYTLELLSGLCIPDPDNTEPNTEDNTDWEICAGAALAHSALQEISITFQEIKINSDLSEKNYFRIDGNTEAIRSDPEKSFKCDQGVWD